MVKQLRALAALWGGPKFKTLYPHNDSQLSVIPFPGDLEPPLASAGPRHARGTQMCMKTKHSYTYALQKLQWKQPFPYVFCQEIRQY